jgi:hypothetical protein
VSQICEHGLYSLYEMRGSSSCIPRVYASIAAQNARRARDRERSQYVLPQMQSEDPHLRVPLRSSEIIDSGVLTRAFLTRSRAYLYNRSVRCRFPFLCPACGRWTETLLFRFMDRRVISSGCRAEETGRAGGMIDRSGVVGFRALSLS